MRKKFFIGFAAVVFLASCKHGSDKAIDLKFRMQKGSKFEYAITVDQDIQQASTKQSMKNSIGMTYLFDVANDNSGWKTVGTTIKNMKMDMEGLGRKLHVDSEQPSQDTSGALAIMNKVFGAMKGANFSFSIDSNGKIGEVRGIAEMQNKIITSLPNEAQGTQNISGFDENTFRQNMAQAFSVYPDKPVKEGDSWTKSTDMRMQGLNITAENTYTLESVNGNDAVIKVSSKLNAPLSKAPNGIEMSVEGTSEGTMHYDIPTGMITDGTTDMRMDMKMKAQGTEMPMSMNMKMTIKGKKQ